MTRMPTPADSAEVSCSIAPSNTRDRGLPARGDVCLDLLARYRLLRRRAAAISSSSGTVPCRRS